MVVGQLYQSTGSWAVVGRLYRYFCAGKMFFMLLMSILHRNFSLVASMVPKHTKRKQRIRTEEKANLFENHFRSWGEENERRMANNVMREMRVYDGYFVCPGLA